MNNPYYFCPDNVESCKRCLLFPGECPLDWFEQVDKAEEEKSNKLTISPASQVETPLI
jgi:hypothetical protein